MPKFANLSVDATNRLRELTGSAGLECYIHIDPERSESSFFVLRTSNNVIHVSFAEIDYDSGRFDSLIEGLYKLIYE